MDTVRELRAWIEVWSEKHEGDAVSSWNIEAPVLDLRKRKGYGSRGLLDWEGRSNTRTRGRRNPVQVLAHAYSGRGSAMMSLRFCSSIHVADTGRKGRTVPGMATCTTSFNFPVPALGRMML